MPLDSSTPERIRKVLAEWLALPADTIHPETRLAEDLGIASLDEPALILELEDAFGLPDMLADDALPGLAAVADLTTLIDRAQDAQRKAGL